MKNSTLSLKSGMVVYCEDQDDLEKLSRAGIYGYYGKNGKRNITEYMYPPCYVLIKERGTADWTNDKEIALIFNHSKKGIIDVPNLKNIEIKNYLLSSYEDVLIFRLEDKLKNLIAISPKYADGIHEVLTDIFAEHKGYYECLQDLGKIENIDWHIYVENDFENRIANRAGEVISEILNENDEIDYD